MIRCSTCGRHLAGLRHDHPMICAVRAAQTGGRRVVLPLAPLKVPRIQIVEDSELDPFTAVLKGTNGFEVRQRFTA